MKKCLVCSADADNDTPTCTACGEASWSEPEPEQQDDNHEDRQDGAPHRQQQGRRYRGGR